MRNIGLLLVSMSLLVGCSTRRLPPTESTPPPIRPEALFPQPAESQSNQLARLDSLLRGPISKLNLTWVADMGLAAVPTCIREAGDETLSVEARDLILLVLGNALRKGEFFAHPDARNDLVVPVLVNALQDPDPRVKRSAALTARFVDDKRLVPVLRGLLQQPAFVQEQAVLALGTSGGEPEIVPIAKLFFGTDDGKFRYSCLYSLAMMCLLHDVDVAPVLEQNATKFGQKNSQNVSSVRGRFVDFKVLTDLVKKLSSGDISERRDADEKLRKLTGRQVAFDPAGDDAARQRGIEEWRRYFLKDYWLTPSPTKP